MNTYARLSEIRSLVDGLGVATDYDDVYLRLAEAASREMDDRTHRHFYSEVKTLYLDGDGTRTLHMPPGVDIISIDTLKVDDTDDGTYEITLTDGDDYRLLPLHATPKYQIELLTRGGQLGRWPARQSSVEITGKFGYSEETETTGLTGTVADDSTEELTASDTTGGIIERGDTLFVEDEQMYVTATDEQTTLTVQRGVNGTTAVAHTDAPILLRTYPARIREAVASRVIDKRWKNNTGDIFGEPGKGVRVEYADFMTVIREFRVLDGLVV